MKAIFAFGVIVATLLCFAFAAFAQDMNFTVKQGMIYLLNDRQVKNMTCLETVKTKKNDAWPKWANMIWEGWSIDLAASYDNAGFKEAALMLGRNFGTLGDYLPLEFPLKDKLKITIYPIGLSVKDLFDEPRVQPACGGAMLQISAKF